MKGCIKGIGQLGLYYQSWENGYSPRLVGMGNTRNGGINFAKNLQLSHHILYVHG